jgi:hypothetical protein
MLLMVAGLTAAASPAIAGEIYGELRADGHPVAPGEPVRITCAGNVMREAKTDRFGSYRIAVPGAGRCVLSYREATFEVALAPDAPARYNFEFTREAGRSALQRR